MPDLTQEQIQALIDKAVEKRTAELKAEVEATVEEQQNQVKQRVLNGAAYEDTRLATDPGSGYQYALVMLDDVDYNPISRRTPEELDAKNVGIKNLAKDIKDKGGLLRPLLVYRKDGRYMLVKGSRRLAALRSMGEEMVHAYILPAKPPIGMEEQWVNGY